MRGPDESWRAAIAKLKTMPSRSSTGRLAGVPLSRSGGQRRSQSAPRANAVRTSACRLLSTRVVSAGFRSPLPEPYLLLLQRILVLGVRLLEHDLGDEDGVRVARAAPRKVALVLAVPSQELGDQVCEPKSCKQRLFVRLASLAELLEESGGFVRAVPRDKAKLRAFLWFLPRNCASFNQVDSLMIV